MSDDLVERIRRALAVGWRKPPARAGRAARVKPPGLPIAPPDADGPAADLVPGDVRSAAVDEEPVLLSRSFPGVDVTVMIVPPPGDGLWTIEGRAWRNPRSEDPIRVVLSLGENVAADATVPSGGRFRFQELLAAAWELEFHLGDRTAVLRGPRAG